MELLKAVNTADQILHSGNSIVFGENTIVEGGAITHTADTSTFTIRKTGLYRVMCKFNYEAANIGTANFELRNYAESAVVEQITQNPQLGTILLDDVLYLAAGTAIEVYFSTVIGTTDVLSISRPVMIISKIR